MASEARQALWTDGWGRCVIAFAGNDAHRLLNRGTSIRAISAWLTIWLLIISAPHFEGRASAASGSAVSTSTSAPVAARPQHVFIIVLENEGFETVFSKNSPAPYLSRVLVSKGELLRQYYAIGHFSLDNYIAMVSGQAPNAYTQNDCPTYYDFALLSKGLDENGQALGAGCVYPGSVLTIANQLEAKQLNWAAYMEDMESNCEHPRVGQRDDHFFASKRTQYATRHNPFVYFRSIIDHANCTERDVPLSRLDHDLKQLATTPNLVFITPNLCHDGHDPQSALCEGGYMVAADRFLPSLVSKILLSPAFLRDGMLLLTFDESYVEIKDRRVVAQGTDSTFCCNEPTGPNTVMPGRSGPGGGRVGALIISPYVRPGSFSDYHYNHYALLRSLEDLFGLAHLGFAAQPGLRAFGDDVYNLEPSSRDRDLKNRAGLTH
jgi:phosphatidylinositol-3-phosphatase